MATYYEPYVKTSDDMQKIVTVSRFAPGASPESLFGIDSFWWTNEEVVKSLGHYLADMRKASQQFAIDNQETYENFPTWDTINGGWQTAFTPITIPPTPENFGMIHGDLHTGNWFVEGNIIDHEAFYSITALDFDNAQRSWYVIDIGTVLFQLNMYMYPTFALGGFNDAYEGWFYQFKRWLTDSYAERYGSRIPEEDLQQGCRWRKDFIYYYFKYSIWTTPPGEMRKYMKGYMDLYEADQMPTC